jgi:uncharacterized membrane protein
MTEGKQWFRDEQTGQFVHDASVWVQAPVDVCFSYWANFAQFPQLMSHIQRVEQIDEGRWHWVAKISGMTQEWDAVVSEFRRPELLAWHSTSGLKNSGTVSFTPENSGCRVRVHLMYDPPLGVIGDMLAMAGMNDAFHRDLQNDLTEFKGRVERDEAQQMRPAA